MPVKRIPVKVNPALFKADGYALRQIKAEAKACTTMTRLAIGRLFLLPEHLKNFCLGAVSDAFALQADKLDIEASITRQVMVEVVSRRQPVRRPVR